MHKFEEVLKKRSNLKYQCEMCNEIFLAKELQLTEPIDKIIMFSESDFLYIDKNGYVVSGKDQPSLKNGDQILSCPYCQAQHLFGVPLAPNLMLMEAGHA